MHPKLTAPNEKSSSDELGRKPLLASDAGMKPVWLVEAANPNQIRRYAMETGLILKTMIISPTAIT